MNRKQLTTLLVIGVFIGGLGFYLSKKRTDSFKASDSSMGQKLMPDFPINDVAQVVIKQATNELNLVKQEDSWKVRERHLYAADFSNLGEFLRKVWELKTVQNVKVGPSQFSKLELTTGGAGTNSATVVEFKDKSGKALRSLLLGKKFMREAPEASQFGGGGDWPAGRYVIAGDQPQKVWLISETFSNIEPKPESWLSKDFFKVEKLRSISITSTNATNQWKLTRETESGTWNLADKKEGEELDSGKTSGLNYALSSPSFNDVLAAGSPADATGLDQPQLVATLETFDQFTYTVKVGSKTGEDSYHVAVQVAGDLPKERPPGKDEKPEDKDKLDKEHKEKVDKLKEKLDKEKSFEKWAFLVSKWTIDPLLKERKDLMAEKKPEPKPEENKDVKIETGLDPKLEIEEAPKKEDK